jgi:two-component system, chemotaxis family, protein-glutamate methylesterase/glutaminase
MERDPQSTVVVVGASAGGLPALQAMVAELPAGFRSPIVVVMHIGRGRSVLPSILERSGRLTSSHVVDGEPLRPGHIHVAPPDFHVLIRQDRLYLSHGPRENHSRPAIDPLFRSAASSYGSRTIGVILSGALSDGTAGLMMIKARGGTVLIQDPDEAIIGGMPESALRMVKVDHVLSASDIGRFLADVPVGTYTMDEGNPNMQDEESEIRLIREDFAEQEANKRDGELTMFTCPDCGGTLWQTGGGAFRCHVGHTWGAEGLLGHKSENLEAALWVCVRMLEERATLSRQVSSRIRETTNDAYRANGIDEEAQLDERRADAIRQLLHQPLNRAIEIVDSPMRMSDADD